MKTHVALLGLFVGALLLGVGGCLYAFMKPDTTEVSDSENVAYFHCSGFVTHTELWVNDDRISFSPDPGQDIVFTTERPDVWARMRSGALEIVDTSMDVPMRPDLATPLRIVEMEPYEVVRNRERLLTDGWTFVPC